MALNDLPPAIRREIPSIAIMFHAYSSDPGERRVMINGNMAKEGETLDDGLGLQQIMPDGVIFLTRSAKRVFTYSVKITALPSPEEMQCPEEDGRAG